MRIAVVNPNSTRTMSDVIAAAARRVAGPDVAIIGLTNSDGPPSIQGVVDGAAAVPGLLTLVASTPADAFIIACFDDTGLDAARCVTDMPVIGIGEAACHAASLVAHRFSIVTTLSRSVPILRNNLETHGLSRKCASILATDIPVLQLEHASGETLARLEATVERAIVQDGAEAVVLGCAGMADLAARLERRFNVPVIDGIASAVGLAATLVRMGVTTSRQGLYASASMTGVERLAI
ncbi:aspartate/glutamate racemase family protein [Mesorhizobium sp. YIM 152430]|uniref:aspartate/glutamate racemase family protein n=1 Tax=Mesorhizobium sp. YIM 152430 TaxID=3031761 RepID=UPI0023DAD135|nr:aspartate/glutamate racemase family protein [Mesorhizobium sp. YIM 152430]MDF1598952.1 aspartate/glutamate racemase family protein [Mesorhizobium sp. YIM 152430]